MKIILLLKNKSQYIILFTIILLIFSCIRKDWENPFDPEDSLEHKITILSPNGDSDIEMGVTDTIKWLSKNVTENISIALYNSKINSLTLIADSIPNNNNGEFVSDSLVESIFLWKVPWNLDDINLTDGTDLFIKIFSAVDSISAFDVSDNSFDLFRPKVEIITPLQGDEWYLELPAMIEWISSKESENVKIELMKDGNIIDTIVISTDKYKYNDWKVPDYLTPDSNYTLKIQSNLNSNVKWFRNNIHIKEPPNIKVKIPDFGNRWVVGQEYMIRWDSDSLMKHTPNVRIECREDSYLLDTIAADALNSGEFNWMVPWGYQESKNYQIKIISVYHDSIYDLSNKFEIDWPEINITYPDANTILRTGHIETIRWNTEDYNKDIWLGLYQEHLGVQKWERRITPTEEGVQDIGEYNWDIPWDIEKYHKYWIRIACPLNLDIDDSTAYFTINWPDIQSVSPTEWMRLQKEQDYTINWINYEFPDTSHVRIELWKDGIKIGDDLNDDDNTLNVGEYNWMNISKEYESGDGYQIKVYCIENNKIERMSNSFKIVD